MPVLAGQTLHGHMVATSWMCELGTQECVSDSLNCYIDQFNEIVAINNQQLAYHCQYLVRTIV
jgi:hypothetical protein